jgi:hypothetical protein
MSFNLPVAGAQPTEHRPLQRYPRALFSVPLTMRNLMTGGMRVSRGISLDISEGGLAAIVPVMLRLGEMVEIEAHITERTLHVVAIVRHTSSLRSGFEFVGLTSDERQQIVDAIGHARWTGWQS